MRTRPPMAAVVGLLSALARFDAVGLDDRWFPVGPAPQDASGFGVAGGVSGRVWTIAFSGNFDRRGTAAMYLGINGGGVWRSTDFTQGAPTWTPLTDQLPGSFPQDRQVGLQNIGALEVDPNHPWIIYAGTGDPAGPGPNGYGRGLLKSTDGGNTWQLLSLGPNPFMPGFTRILVDPTDSSGATVYATGGFGPNSPLRGIYKSSNGGVSWTVIQNGMPAAVAITDLDYMLTGNRLTLLAGLNDMTGRAGGNNGIWQSTNGGSFWGQMFITPLVGLTGQPVSESQLGLIKLAADHASGSPHGAFAVVSRADTSDLVNVFTLKSGVWKPTGAGITGITSTWGALSIGVSEQGAVYIGMGNASQDGIFQSTDGGNHWSSIFVDVNGTHPHHDQRCWAFFKGGVFEGNDGGISRFLPLPNNQTGVGTWQSLNTPGLQTILSNGLGLHPSYPNVLLEGSQDNGVALRNGGAWKYVTGDDDARPRFDPHDARYAYRTGVSELSFFFRSSDGGLSWPDDKSPPGGAGYYAPYAFHPTISGRIAVGTDRVYETVSRGDQWVAISGRRAGASSVTALAYGPADVLYVALGGRLFKTINHGGNGDDANWPELNVGNNWRGSIVSLAVDRHADERIYAATDGAAVWQSLDRGASWTDITSNLPPAPFTINGLALRSDTATIEPTLFVATSVGVYSSAPAAGQRHWERTGTGLPDVFVSDVQYHDNTKYLVASTSGRGLFAAYLHYLTDAGLGNTSLNNTVFAFARDLDGRISANQAAFGHAFSGWVELQGGGRTDAPPAATAVKSSVFVFIKGLDRRVYLNQAEFGHPYSGWFEVQGNERTDAAPSAATLGDHVFVFIKGLDGRVLLNQADLGHAFGEWFEVQGNGRTDTAPAATMVKSSVFVFIKGLDRKIYLNQAEFRHGFGSWFEVQGGGLTDAAPAAATIGDHVFVLIKGVDHRIYVNQADFGHAFSGWTELQGDGLTDTAPAAVTVGNSLFVFIKGLDGRIYLNQAELGHAFSGWFEVGGGLQ